MSDRLSVDKVIGILYPGEMGSALGKLMADAGFKIVTTLEERGTRTARLSQQAGLQVVTSCREVVQISDIVISLVPPSVALHIAERYCEFAQLGPENQIFIDANSISPETAKHICSMITSQKRSFVDAAIQGLASSISSRGVLVLSGAKSQEVADLFAPVIKVKLLGDIPGRASAYKMIISGIPKGIVALFLELSAAAEKLDLLDEMLLGLRDLYPGIMEVIDRLLPSYPLHAERRGDEMGELERTLLSLELQPGIVREVRRITTEIGRLGLADHSSQKELGGWTARDVILAINSRGLFRTE